MMFKNNPKKDWSCHGADALRYSSLDDRPSYFPDDHRGGRGRSGELQFADMDYDELAA